MDYCTPGEHDLSRDFPMGVNEAAVDASVKVC